MGIGRWVLGVGSAVGERCGFWVFGVRFFVAEKKSATGARTHNPKPPSIPNATVVWTAFATDWAMSPSLPIAQSVATTT